MLNNILIVALGGAIGAVSRYLLSIILQPITLFSVNINIVIINFIGSLLLGILSGLIESGNINQKLNMLLSVGIFGALTTFSTFSKEAFALIEDQKIGLALFYILFSVIFGIIFYSIGKITYLKLINN